MSTDLVRDGGVLNAGLLLPALRALHRVARLAATVIAVRIGLAAVEF